MLEDDLRQIMAEETARLRAAPDLVDRVVRSSRRRKTVRTRYVAMVAAVAVAGITVPTGLTLASGPTAGGPAATASPDTTDHAVPQPFEPPPLPTPSPTRDFGDLGDGKAFGHVKVGYLPDGLRWSNWSIDSGDEYTTAWNYDGDKNGFYCVQIFVYEDQSAQRSRDRVRSYRDESEGEEVTIGGRTGYLVTQWVGEDGGKGTPTMFLDMGPDRMAEIMFSPVFAKKLHTRKAVERELRKIALELTSDDGGSERTAEAPADDDGGSGTTTEAPVPDGGDPGTTTRAPASGG
ncbi:hypothetical protein ACQPYK_15275 [Streptosporangium sp. CA-135522]|uniref:hypothetical protein n=1 Tax=Streptosporangium sp. CA-135522 TaxID=3240072 RepID=UPI003D8B9A61